jgi:hypothetical protein
MTDPKKDEKSPHEKLPKVIRGYIIFGGIIILFVAIANTVGWYPTYGIFSGENSMHSSSHYGHGGYYGIHGK